MITGDHMSSAFAFVSHARDASGSHRKLLATGIVTGLAITVAPTTYATTYTVTNINDSGPGSLRAAITQANSDAIPPTVIAIPSTVTGTITLTTGEVYITHAMTVQGPGASKLSVSSGGSGRVLHVSTVSGALVSLSGLRIADGSFSAGNGAGLAAYGADLTLSNCVFDNNTAANGKGGGIYQYGANINMSGVIVQNNNARTGGGVAIRNAGTLLIQSSLVSDNHASGGGAYGGGGLFVQGSTASQIRSTRIINNYAIASGGGAQFVSGTQSFSDGEVSGNTSRSGAGGGIHVYLGTLDMQRTTVSANTAQADGGGLQLERSYSPLGGAAIQDSTISGNRTTLGFGGGVNINNDSLAQVKFSNVTIYGNYALWGSGGGGGIHSRIGDSRYAPLGNGVLTLESCTIVGNQAYKGGGIVSGAFGNFVVMHNGIVANNVALTSADPFPDPDVEGTFDAAYDLITVVGDATVFAPPGSNITNTDPQLGPLTGNGGPTATLLPALGSPAIDAGDPHFTAPPIADQRGLPRVAGAHVDIGAVERQTPEDAIFRNSFEPP